MSGRCLACSQENCGYRRDCDCTCHPENKKKPKRKLKRYVALTDPDDCREGEIRLGGEMGDEHWEGGQLIFKWRAHNGHGGSTPPSKVTRMVDLANKALER